MVYEERVFVEVGDAVQFAKTVSESDVYQFAGITGDFAPNHIDEEYMRETQFGRRIAHGALLVGYMSTCSTRMAGKAAEQGVRGAPMSVGYDKIRFIAPVFFGDTISFRYEISEIDPQRLRAWANITATNQGDDVVAIATHIMQWVEN